MEAYCVDNGKYIGATAKKLFAWGLRISEGVRLRVLSANKEGFVIEAFHSKGDKKYIIGSDGRITEENIK